MKKIVLLLLLLPLLCQAQQYNRDSLEQIVEKHILPDSVKDYNGYINQLYPAIIKATMNEQFRERLRADATIEIINMSTGEDPKPFVDKYFANSHTDSLKMKVTACYRNFLNEYGAILPGKVAPNFSFVDNIGKEYRVSDFLGKTLLIDIWGTWCAPCIAEIPYLEKLQQHYSNNNDVLIISIACDKKVEKWKSFLSSHKTSWHQYIISQEGDTILDNIYHVNGIPRFIIIDKYGKIVTSDAPRPSEDDFNKYFSNAIKK
jgi:thiol-disulfide isomerase/thioredoxin